MPMHRSFLRLHDFFTLHITHGRLAMNFKKTTRKTRLIWLPRMATAAAAADEATTTTLKQEMETETETVMLMGNKLLLIQNIFYRIGANKLYK